MLERLRAVRNDGQRQDGFTLIELLIVIVILGVLAAIVVFSVTGVTNNSKINACKSDVQSIDTAAEAYYAQKGSSASALDDGTTSSLVGAGFLHASATIKGSTETTPDFTVTFTPGGGTTTNAAGDASSTFCP